MVGPNFLDDIDCSNFFDHIDDLLDFPDEDNINNNINSNENPLIGGESDSFPSLWPDPADSFPVSDPVLSGNKSNSASDLPSELYVPYEDIVQLEWLSNFVEDSFSGGSSMPIPDKQDSTTIKHSSPNQSFRTSSPISVLESSSSSSGGGKPGHLSPETAPPPLPGRCGRARSKRPRPPTFNPRPSMQLISPTSSFTETPQPLVLSPKMSSSESDNFAESRPLMKIPAQEQQKKKKIKVSFPSRSPVVEMKLNREATNPPPSSQSGVRKCLHCEITKTPQWRAGPLGPKTLCNACGVRYKSGRLFPEYRPAASPTFVPSLHSNSHKKVVEMRKRTVENDAVIGDAMSELIPNTNPLVVDYM